MHKTHWLLVCGLLLFVGLAFAKPSSRPVDKKTHHQGHTQHHPHASMPPARRGSGKKHLPPIDCPFAKKGMKHHMKPFKDIQKYIAMLERPDRAAWQKPDLVVKALKLKGNEKVADVGAGSGYFSFRIAKSLPKGMVYAIDVEPNMLKYIHHNTMMKGIQNVQIVFGEKDDPKVPKGSDLVFICDVLHHIQKRKLWLTRMFQSLKSKAKVVVIEFKEGKLPKGPPEKMKIPKKQLIKMFTSVGFKKTGSQPKLLPYQEFIVFQKP